MKFKWILLALILFAAGMWAGRSLFPKVVSSIPAPTRVQFASQTDSTGAVVPLSNEILEVKDGGSILDAVKKANPGDLIRVYPGTYKETVYIDKDNISFQGIIIDGEWPILDGEKELNDAFLYSGNGIQIENFKIMNYKGNGIMGQAGNNFVIRNNWVIDAGVYGIFPEFGQNGLIEHNILTGIEDAAIYVGMCDNIDVRHNEVYGNVAGIEIENSRHALVENNYAHGNTGGILAFITPGLPIKTAYDIIIRNNFVVDNNHENFGAPGSIVSGIPPGTGIIIMAADEVTIENNIITGNNNTGIAITDLSMGANLSKDPESEPNPDRIVILDNYLEANGKNPVGELKILMKAKMLDRAPDIVAVGGGTGSCIRNRDRYNTYGLGDYGQCEVTDTKDITTFLLDKPVAPRQITMEEKGNLTFYGVCAGCHAYDVRMIGPPVNTIQAIYKDNPQGIADFIAAPTHKREGYPEMPPQNYLSEETRLAVANYMLKITQE
ncbi:MAG: right-handed parallel beta-helix repeat-containing protein [Cyclobacteriaceae bacterium]|nr:right-handed parallel beta-helix repeat-containing protein [Cyclobacteriaceae bacterium]